MKWDILDIREINCFASALDHISYPSVICQKPRQTSQTSLIWKHQNEGGMLFPRYDNCNLLIRVCMWSSADICLAISHMFSSPTKRLLFLLPEDALEFIKYYSCFFYWWKWQMIQCFVMQAVPRLKMTSVPKSVFNPDLYVSQNLYLWMDCLLLKMADSIILP